MNKKYIIKIRKFFAMLIISLIIFSGCATMTTQYQRKNVDNSELIWTYNKGLKVIKNNTVICSDNWNGLSEAVASVPDAYNLAMSAKKKHKMGRFFQLIGVPVAIGSFIGGAVVLSEETYSYDSPFSSKGFWIMVGGMTLGMSVGITGGHLTFRAKAEAIDAVNIYNYNYKKYYLLENK